jgi:hypothetical protein
MQTETMVHARDVFRLLAMYHVEEREIVAIGDIGRIRGLFASFCFPIGSIRDTGAFAEDIIHEVFAVMSSAEEFAVFRRIITDRLKTVVDGVRRRVGNGTRAFSGDLRRRILDIAAGPSRPWTPAAAFGFFTEIPMTEVGTA